MQLVDPQSTSTFTTRELVRLSAYRAAVVAGFYTDWDGSAASTDTGALAWLGPAGGNAGDAADGYAFSAEERKHLAALRDSVAAGGFADDRPPAAAPTAATPDEPGR